MRFCNRYDPSFDRDNISCSASSRFNLFTPPVSRGLTEVYYLNLKMEINPPQSVLIYESNEFYHNLLSNFLTTARYNKNSYFELRIQHNVLQYKLSTTLKPYNGTIPPPNFSRLPPPAPPQGRNGRMKGSDPPQKKRLYAAIQTPSPTKSLHRAATVNSLDVAKSNEVSSNMHDQSIADPPEIVREGRNQHESEATAKISANSPRERNADTRYNLSR